MRLLLLLMLLTTVMPACQIEDEGEASGPSTTTTAPDAASTADETPAEFSQVMAFAKDRNLHERPLGEVMQEVGEQLKGKPYIAGTLDQPGEEKLICRMDGFDCVTFLESAMAMARGIKAQDYSFATFQDHVLDSRYRGGDLAGYCSRLHYFSDWIRDNEIRGNVEDVTESLGGVRMDKKLNFMSTHRDSYRAMASDETFACVQEMEENLAETELYYIPKDRIRAAYPELQAGDIIATATNIPGLDVTHTGLVYDAGDGKRGFLHASTSGGVKISPDLQSYVQANSKLTGIMVARPIEE